MNKFQRELYETTLESLRTHPEQWATDGYYLVEHPSGVSVWIANGHYGLEIQVNKKRVVGGVTGWSSLFGPMIPWRAKLRSAALSLPGSDNGAREALSRLSRATA